RVADTEGVLDALTVVGALRQVEVAHAEVPAIPRTAPVLRADLVAVAHLVVDTKTGVDADRGVARQAVHGSAGWRLRHDRLRVERVVAVHRHGNARLALGERSLEADAVALLLGRLLGRCKRVARVQRLVPESEVGAAAPSAHAGTRDDIHADHARPVILRRERVPRDANLLDLVLGRQASAAEAVDEDLRPGAGYL